jgi:hypothetical protein
MQEGHVEMRNEPWECSPEIVPKMQIPFQLIISPFLCRDLLLFSHPFLLFLIARILIIELNSKLLKNN